jgi:hypothetical protein
MNYHREAYELEPHLEQGHTQEMRPFEDFLAYWREYARQRPEVAAIGCFAIGFVLGWKLKPW